MNITGECLIYDAPRDYAPFTFRSICMLNSSNFIVALSIISVSLATEINRFLKSIQLYN